VLAYLAMIHRKRDIEMNGRPDLNGIIRAPVESFIKTVTIFIDCIMLGYIIHFMMLKTKE